MIPANLMEFTTPKNVSLRGFWLGPLHPKRVIIFVHGLTGSAFSRTHLLSEVTDGNTAVLTFNNRGHDVVSLISQKKGAKSTSILGGSAHEVFTDCIDDIDGAIRYVRRMGIKDIFLAGHSTGCQKIVYYMAKQKKPYIKGIILLAPLSDYAGERKKPQLRRALAAAKRLVKAGKKHELLPPGTWWAPYDAQRFLSLYSPDSVEELFPYAQPSVKPKLFASITTPTQVFLARDDEYADRPAEEIRKWFMDFSKARTIESHVIWKTGHSFSGQEVQVAKAIRQWISR